MRDLLRADLLAGRTIFVSGGGSGVNLGIARVAARCGASLTICGRTQSRLDQAAAVLRAEGARVVTAVADVRDRDAVAAAFEASEQTLGPADAVICGAAGNFLAPAEAISTNGFKAVLEIDLLGAFHCATAGFEQLRRTQGSLLFVSGGQTTMALMNQAHVAAAKAGIDQLMRSLAVEWGVHGIRSNSIVPGPVAGTEGMRRLAEGGLDDAWSSSVVLGRFAEPEEVGAIAVVLISPIASFVTGSHVFVDGGLNLAGPVAINAAVAPREAE